MTVSYYYPGIRNAIKHNELEIKDTTYAASSVSYRDLHHEIDSNYWLRTKPYDKRDDLNFPIVNFPFISNNIPAAPAYGVYISQLIRYSRACASTPEGLAVPAPLMTPVVLI
jgi:hypothetical protein